MTKRFPYKVPNGSDITLDGQTWRVEGKDRDGFLVTGDEGAQTILTFDRVGTAIAHSKCQITTPNEREEILRLREYTNGFTDIAQLPEEQQRNARALAALINAIDELEAEGQKITHAYLNQPVVRKKLYTRALEITGDKRLFDGLTLGSTKPNLTEPTSVFPKGRTLCERRATYQSFGRNPVVLAHRHHKKGIHREAACKLSDWQQRVVFYCINRLLDPRAPRLSDIYGITKGLMPVPEGEMLAGRSHPSLVTVRNWVKRTSFVAREYARRGNRNAKNRYGSGATDQRALMFGERVLTDQVYLSIFIKSDGSTGAKKIDPSTVSPKLGKKEIIRVWMHLMVDHATRMPLAWLISETTNSDHTFHLLRMATRDKTKEKTEFGCKNDPAPPAGLLLTVADNGTATRNGSVYSSKLGAGAAVQTGRTHHSNDNSTQERIFETFQFSVLNFESGYVGSKPGDNPGYDAEAHTRLTALDIMGVASRYFIDEYPIQPHRGIGMFGATPAEKLEEVLELYGGVEAPDPEKRIIHFGMKRTVSTTSEGILFEGIPYTSTELNLFSDGRAKKVDVYLDPDFLETVIVMPHGTSQKIKAKLSYSAYADLTYHQAKQLMREAAQGDPNKRDKSNKDLLEAKAKRGRRGRSFPDPNCHESYVALPRYEKKAKENAQIGKNNDAPLVHTTKPGSITERSHKTSCKDGASTPDSQNASVPKFEGSFPPVTKSKL